MATWAVGDLQGCADALDDLLERIGYRPGDQLWFVGDLVNRGPGSLRCLRRVRGLGDDAVVVLGNHDLHLLALASGVDGPRDRDTLGDILAAPDRDELLDWLLHRPLIHHDPSLGATLVHAGLHPDWDLATALDLGAQVADALLRAPGDLFRQMYGDRPDRWSDDLEGADRLRFAINVLTRMRFLTEDKRLDLETKGGPDEAPAGLRPWFRFQGRAAADTRVVFGHWSTLGLLSEPGLLALDTGCVWGGALTAVRLDRAADPVQVNCSASQRI